MSAVVAAVERRPGVAIVRLARATRMNSLSRELLLELGRLGQELPADPSLRALVITGEGDRAFCAGADLKERKDMSEDDVREQLKLYRHALGWLLSCPVPTLAALNGVALGGGLELALLCDFRVTAPHAELGLPETTLGIIPGAGGTQLLPRLIGEAKAKELILLGRRVSAEQALQLGLVHRVAPAGVSVVDDAIEWLRPVIDGAPIAVRAALAAVRAALTTPLAVGLELERALYDDCLRSSDRREALAAFAEKRSPVFRGE